MNLDNLKPAWRQFCLLNSMQPMDQQEILLLLEKNEVVPVSKTYRLLISAMVLAVLTFSCQGG